MGYQGEALQRFVKEQQEREERLLAQEREERREERQRQHELQLRRLEAQSKAQKRVEGDGQGECCWLVSPDLNRYLRKFCCE